MRYHLLNKKGDVLISNLPIEHIDFFNTCSTDNDLISKNKGGGKAFRHGKKVTEFGTIYLIADEEEILASPRLWKEKQKIYSDFLSEASKMKQKVLTDTLHNLTTINAHSIQELYSLVPQELLTRNLPEQLDAIKRNISSDINISAKTFLRMAKHNAAMKAQFTALKSVYFDDTSLQIRNHFIKQVLLNGLHNFYQDFNENGIKISIEDTNKNLRLDYETFSAALVPFFDNAVKYVLPNTEIKINFTIVFTMISLQIKPYELEKIYTDGISGENAKLAHKQGNGIGMTNITKLLAFNNAVLMIRINTDPSKSVKRKNLFYEENIFEINFNT